MSIPRTLASTLAKAAIIVVGTAIPGYATEAQPKWCAGVKVAVINPGWPQNSGDLMSPIFESGFRQAELDLGPTVTYAFGHWDPDLMRAELEKAIDAKVEGVIVAGHPGDAAVDDLIDKAFAQGTIVTTMNMPLPEAQRKHSSAGMGSVGAPNHAAGFALASEVIKRASLKAGDRVLVWGNKGSPSDYSQRSIGMIDAFEKTGVKVVYQEVDSAYAHGSGDPTGTFVAAIKANPDLKAVLTDSAGLAWSFGLFARIASLKPGQIYLAGFVLTPETVAAIKEGYVNLILDEQPYLQGYLPVLNTCLTKKYGFSGLDFNTLGTFIDAHNVDAVAPLVEKSIR